MATNYFDINSLPQAQSFDDWMGAQGATVRDKDGFTIYEGEDGRIAGTKLADMQSQYNDYVSSLNNPYLGTYNIDYERPSAGTNMLLQNDRQSQIDVAQERYGELTPEQQKQFYGEAGPIFGGSSNYGFSSEDPNSFEYRFRDITDPDYLQQFEEFQAKYPGYAQISPDLFVGDNDTDFANMGNYARFDPESAIYDEQYGILLPFENFGHAGMHSPFWQRGIGPGILAVLSAFTAGQLGVAAAGAEGGAAAGSAAANAGTEGFVGLGGAGGSGLAGGAAPYAGSLGAGLGGVGGGAAGLGDAGAGGLNFLAANDAAVGGVDFLAANDAAVAAGGAGGASSIGSGIPALQGITTGVGAGSAGIGELGLGLPALEGITTGVGAGTAGIGTLGSVGGLGGVDLAAGADMFGDFDPSNIGDEWTNVDPSNGLGTGQQFDTAAIASESGVPYNLAYESALDIPWEASAADAAISTPGLETINELQLLGSAAGEFSGGAATLGDILNEVPSAIKDVVEQVKQTTGGGGTTGGTMGDIMEAVNGIYNFVEQQREKDDAKDLESFAREGVNKATYDDDPSAYLQSPLARAMLDEMNRAFAARNAKLGKTFSIDETTGKIRGSGTGFEDWSNFFQANMGKMYQDEMERRRQKALLESGAYQSSISNLAQTMEMENQARRNSVGGTLPYIGDIWNVGKSIFDWF